MTAPSRMLPCANTSRQIGSSPRDCASIWFSGAPSSRAVFARELGCLGAFDRLLRPRLRPQPQHVPVRILDLHLECPRVVRRRHADGHAAGLQFLIEDCNVPNAEPDPCPTASLAAATQVDARAVDSSRDAAKECSPPRKPWVKSENLSKPRRAKEKLSATTPRLLPRV